MQRTLVLSLVAHPGAQSANVPPANELSECATKNAAREIIRRCYPNHKYCSRNNLSLPHF